jgi:polyhydroxyalkanoate synthesis regulator protein
MLFAEHMENQSKFNAIGYQIIRIFSDARAIPGYDRYFEYNKKMPDFYIESMDIENTDVGPMVAIHTSCWVGDSQEQDTIKVPLDLIDNFSEDAAKLLAEGMRVAQEQADAAKAAAAAKKADDEKRAQLASLLKEFPDMAPATA